MTLHGEQEGEEFDEDLAKKNAAEWNSWVCRDLDPEILKSALTHTEFDFGELGSIKGLFLRAWRERNQLNSAPPEMPNQKEEMDLRGIDFSTPINCEKMIFRRANFDDSKFSAAVSFKGAFFCDAASFEGTVFDAFATFQNIKALGNMSFKGRVVSRDFSVAAAHFFDTVHFSEAHFSGRVDFYQRRFGVHGGKPNGITFANAIFDAPVSFEAADFTHTLPTLSNTTLPASTKLTADRDKWPKTPKWFNIFDRTYKGWSPENHKSAKASAARMRHAMSQQSLPEEEHFFFRKEMFHAQRAESWWKVLHIEMFDVLSEYGYSITRPVFWLAVVWALGTWAYATSTQFTWSLLTAAGYSFAAMFKFFGFQGTYLAEETAALGPGYELFAACQTVAGFVLLFFLGLGLRTRFRLR